jgi:hypothetical protein
MVTYCPPSNNDVEKININNLLLIISVAGYIIGYRVQHSKGQTRQWSHIVEALWITSRDIGSCGKELLRALVLIRLSRPKTINGNPHVLLSWSFTGMLAALTLECWWHI